MLYMWLVVFGEGLIQKELSIQYLIEFIVETYEGYQKRHLHIADLSLHKQNMFFVEIDSANCINTEFWVKNVFEW